MESTRRVRLRRARLDDLERVFAWRNDPWIISRSTSLRAVTREEHKTWFQNCLADCNRLMLIIEAGGVAIGQLRFDRSGTEVCVVTVYLMEAFSGKGLGIEAIHQGCVLVFREWPDLEEIIACVRDDNAVGQAAFRKAGFEQSYSATLCPAAHAAFTLRRTP